MCLSPKIPKPVEPPKPAQREDASVARDRELRRRAGAKGFSSTIMTSPLGAPQSGGVAVKTLLGG